MTNAWNRGWMGGVLFGLVCASPGLAAGPTRAASEPDAALVDALMRKMEASGALDAAVDRAIDRYVKRREAARQAGEKEQAKLARPVDPEQDHVRGLPTAEVSLIEYSDFECPYCKRFHDTPKALLSRYAARVNWVFRNFPLSFHDPAATNEALASECVAQLGGNDAYWKYADALFANTRSNGAGLPSDKSTERLAEAVGIDNGRLAKCVSDDETRKRLERDMADGAAVGVTGTPTTVVRNNRTGASEAIVGALPADALVPVIDRMLKAKP